jgi:hypothetical protein
MQGTASEVKCSVMCIPIAHDTVTHLYISIPWQHVSMSAKTIFVS